MSGIQAQDLGIQTILALIEVHIALRGDGLHRLLVAISGLRELASNATNNICPTYSDVALASLEGDQRLD